MSISQLPTVIFATAVLPVPPLGFGGMSDSDRSVKRRRTCSSDCSTVLNSLKGGPEASAHILRLPVEVLMYILLFLDQTEWVRLSCVNRLFRSAVDLLLRSVKSVDFREMVQSSRGLKAEHFVTYFLSNACSLNELVIHGSVLSSIRRPLINEMLYLGRLRKLDISFCRIDVTMFGRLLRGLPQLEELYMDGSLSYARKDRQKGPEKVEPANGIVSKALSSLTRLRVLHFSYNDKVTGEVLLSLPKDHLEEVTFPRALYLFVSKRNTRLAYQRGSISYQKGISLSLNNWRVFELEVIDEILSKCRNLAKLNLSSPERVPSRRPVGQPAPLHITLVDSLPNPELLKSFSFHDTRSDFTLSFREFFKKCPHLEELCIDSPRVLTVDCVNVLLENCCTLSKLELHAKLVRSTELMRRIGRFPSLKRLIVECPQALNGFDEFTFETFCSFASNHLEELDLGHLRVPKGCLHSLGRLKNLTTLRLGWDTMENEVLQAIPAAVYANLSHLEVHDAPKITEGCLLLVCRHLRPPCRVSFVNLCSSPLVQGMLNRFNRMLNC